MSWPINLMLLAISALLFLCSFWIGVEVERALRTSPSKANGLYRAYIVTMLTIWRVLLLGAVYFSIATWP